MPFSIATILYADDVARLCRNSRRSCCLPSSDSSFVGAVNSSEYFSAMVNAVSPRWLHNETSAPCVVDEKSYDGLAPPNCVHEGSISVGYSCEVDVRARL